MRRRTRARTTIAIVLSLPILLLFAAFDLAKLPVIILLSPLWALMSLIEWLRGEDPLFFSMLGEVSVMGISLWMELVGIQQPRWMGGI